MSLGPVLVGILSVCYPLVWYWGREQGLFPWLALLMALLWAWRAARQTERSQRIVSMLLAFFFLLVLAIDRPDAMYWYPVLVSGLMLLVFGGSLFAEQTIIERLARLRQPDLPPEGVRYTRRVTQVWCGFFVVNATIVLLLIALQAWQAWALYTGLIAYGLMGLLFVGEWCCRQRLTRKKP